MINKNIIEKLKKQNKKNEDIQNKLKNLGERILAETENFTINEIESNYTEVDQDASERIKMLGQKIQTLIEETEQNNKG